MSSRPLVALTTGDPAGIGPELVQRAFASADLKQRMRLVGVGPASLCPPGLTPTSAITALTNRTEEAWLATETRGSWEPGRPQASAGHAALSALRAGVELADGGRVGALVTAPVSKEALHLAGERVEGQTELLGRWAGVPVQMLGCAGPLRVLLLTRHLPLARALEEVREEAVFLQLGRLASGLQELGFERPRLALAGLNPHAGESGLLGREEIEILTPALERAREAGIDVRGPFSPDTVFLRCARGEFDAVLALYHDQAFIPLKLAAPEHAFTVILGLPYLRLSPAHGTAFDIVGQGIARSESLFAALEQAAAWAGMRSAARGHSQPLA